MTNFITDTQAAEQLQNYQLPSNLLPAITNRRLFRGFSKDALERVVSFIRMNPESRGMTSHIVRQICGLERPSDPKDAVTMEAHLDATILQQQEANAAIASGFGPDPFLQFNPTHYTDHYTLKFKVAAAEVARRGSLIDLIHVHCETLYNSINRTPSIAEAYIEFEVYRNNRNRRIWNLPSQPQWEQSYPLNDWAIESILPPRTLQDALNRKVPFAISKKADIHIKLNKGEKNRQKIIRHVCESGFYHVRTGANNDVLTAQFAHMRDAKKMFDSLEPFFGRYGGCKEMTLEPLRHLWRTSKINQDGSVCLASLPPLILKVG